LFNYQDDDATTPKSSLSTPEKAQTSALLEKENWVMSPLILIDCDLDCPGSTVVRSEVFGSSHLWSNPFMLKCSLLRMLQSIQRIFCDCFKLFQTRKNIPIRHISMWFMHSSRK